MSVAGGRRKSLQDRRSRQRPGSPLIGETATGWRSTCRVPPRERMLIAQLSDLHIRPRGQAYGGVAQSNVQLRLVVDHLHSLDTRPDVVVVSGDLADEGSPDEHVEVAT